MGGKWCGIKGIVQAENIRRIVKFRIWSAEGVAKLLIERIMNTKVHVDPKLVSNGRVLKFAMSFERLMAEFREERLMAEFRENGRKASHGRGEERLGRKASHGRVS
ncbi:hypothetical protein CEXT_765761 [Caerostris extrusa]|uniref:Uncharacterized protein n=1 Tax=Caerostris extrusa TaxID=172846 RepID=A0AAV4XGI3_CAEEX|nr:hypothetical protein CEXT_765761 [Caerostris extrusa]